MIKYIFYCIYNLIYQIVCFWLLLFIGLYYNPSFIPNALLWKNDKPRTDLTGLIGAALIDIPIFIIEAFLIMLPIYFINKLYLHSTFKKDNSNKILKWTVKINIILVLCFITILVLGSFRGLLW